MKTNKTLPVVLAGLLVSSSLNIMAQKQKKGGDSKINSAMFDKIKTNDAEGLKTLLSVGGNANDLVLPGNPALYTSSSWYADCARVLIDAGADVNGTNMAGQLPSHAAANWGNEAVLKMLRKKGADFSSTDNTGATPLELAYTSCKTAVFEELLTGDALKNTNINTALMEYILLCCSQQERVEHIQKNVVFWKQAGVKILDWMTNTDPNYFSSPTDIIAIFKKNGANLSQAAQLKMTPFLKTICSTNATMKKINNTAPSQDVTMSPLELAVQMQKSYIIEALIANGAKISDIPGGEGAFLRKLANNASDFNAFKNVFEKYTPSANGALMAITPEEQESAYEKLYKSVVYKNADALAVKWFLAHGCSPSKFSDRKPTGDASNDLTPFSYALLAGQWYNPELDSLNLSILKLLLEAKADPNGLCLTYENSERSYETATVKGTVNESITFSKTYLGFLNWYKNVHFGEKNEDLKQMKKKLKKRLEQIEAHSARLNTEGKKEHIIKQIDELIALLKANGATEN